MNKVYNSQDEIASNIVELLKKCGISRKHGLNIIPYIIIGMISAYHRTLFYIVFPSIFILDSCFVS